MKVPFIGKWGIVIAHAGKSKAWIAGLSWLAIIGCTTREGRIVDPGAGRGLIIVREKNGLDAKIYLDSCFTGKTTLDGRLEPNPVGRHVAHLRLDKYRSIPDSIVFDLTRDGIELTFELQPVPFGNIQITSTPGNAAVTMNGIEAGMTPEAPGQSLVLAGVPAGSYELIFRHGNYQGAQTLQVTSGSIATVNANLSLQQHALIEDFTNTSCDGCPEVSGIVESLIRDRRDIRITNNETHASFPSPSDPLYLAAKAAHDNLLKIYKPAFLPAVYCNGTKLHFGTNYALVAPLLDSLLDEILALPASANLIIASDGTGGGEVTVAAVGSALDGATLRLELLQKTVRYSAPPGTNKQTVFHKVIRGSLNDAKGVPITLQKGQTVSFPFRFDIAAYARNELLLVASLQNDATKAILQSNWGRL